jgi:hypothetical protein
MFTSFSLEPEKNKILGGRSNYTILDIFSYLSAYSILHGHSCKPELLLFLNNFFTNVNEKGSPQTIRLNFEVPELFQVMAHLRKLPPIPLSESDIKRENDISNLIKEIKSVETGAIRGLRPYREKWVALGLNHPIISPRWIPSEFHFYHEDIRREVKIWLLIALRLGISRDLTNLIIGFISD